MAKQLNILHIIPNLMKGGAERLVIDICNELVSSCEHRIKIICFRPENDYAFATQKLDIQVIPSHVTPSLTGKNQVNVNQLQAEINAFQPDIIHSHLFESEMILSEINYPNASYFLHFHDNMHQFSKQGKQQKGWKQKITDSYEKKKVVRAYRKRSTHALAISKDTFEYASSVLPESVQKTLVPNAISYQRFFAPIQRNEVFRIVKTGSLVPKKGHELALEVIQRLSKLNLPVQFDILGNGPLLESLKQSAKQKGIADRVHFHGNVDHPETFLHDASIYLHTASYEPFGLVLLEAMAAGFPIVCTDGYGNRELIINGENGFLFEERSAEAITQKIAELISDRDLAEKIGKGGQEFSKSFDIQSYVDRLIQLYQGS